MVDGALPATGGAALRRFAGYFDAEAPSPRRETSIDRVPPETLK
jgi:hypothetical protein